MIFYSSSTNSFFSEEIHGRRDDKASKIPPDAVEITEDQHRELMTGQSFGRCIAPDENGRPCLVDRQASAEEQAAIVRAQRDAKLGACDWTVLSDAPLTTTEKANWKAYRQALRDVSAQPGFPASIEWPEAPK